MVMKHEHLMKENFSNSDFAPNNLDSSNLFHRLNYVANNGISCIENNLRTPSKTVVGISPYLNGTKLQILSQISEKKVLQKRSTDITSSFAQACKIYRANSDEFRCNKKKNKKDKISPLNKFHEPSIPQAVSDMNDSEYLKRVDNNRRYKQKKRRVSKDICRPIETKTYEFYNGDLLCPPRMKADSDNSNKNKAKNCNMLKRKKKKKAIENIQSSDVWSMLRDMNTFQYISSPPISVGSVETIKKKGKGKFRKKEKEAGFIERCTTEEFSYISSYDITSNSQTVLSRQSSFDRVTIIDRTGDYKAKKVFDLNPSTLKKKMCKGKHHTKNKQDECQYLTKHPNQLEICNIKNGVNDHFSTDLKKCFSSESMGGSLNECDSQATVLNNCDKSMEKIMSKDKFIKITPKKQSTFVQCNNMSEAIKRRQSNNKLLEAAEKSSKVALTLSNTKIFNDYNNKGKEMYLSTRELRKNPRASIITPKLTKTEIRRRLANLKFPIVVLGKDEISSQFHVVHYDFEQFNGLSKHIWLYMTEWLEDLKSTNKYKSFINSLNNFDSTSRKDKVNKLLSNSKNECNKFEKDTEYRLNSAEIKNSKLINAANVETNKNNKKTQKTKVLNQFKNKMLGFISNKNQKYSADGKSVPKDNINYISINRKNVQINSEENTNERNKNLDAAKNLVSNKYPWSKVKWASDFIDNILRKMKKGIYYTQNCEDVKSKLDNDTSIPVEGDLSFQDVKEEMSEETTENAIIPGFDDAHYIAPIIVEVKMVTRTQISIYHCSTNVVLQFDITIPPRVNTIPSMSLSSFAPVKHEDQTTLYKCKTSLPNGALPAELCSIIPKLITKINETHEKIQQTPKKETTSSIVSYKSTLKLPNVVERLTKGTFSMRDTPMKIISERNCNQIFNWDSYCTSEVMKLLPTIEIKSFSVPMFKRVHSTVPKYHRSNCTEELVINKPVPNNCKALVLYVPPIKANILSYCNFNFKLHNDLQKRLTGYINFVSGINFCRDLTNCAYYNNTNNIDRSSLKPNAVSDISDGLNGSVNLPYKAIHDTETAKTRAKKFKNEKSSYQCLRKNIRKTFKSHSKCKSMTNMAKECCCTPINKIVNLDDFLQALGCCKLLTAVLQGYSEKKILSCINEMKCWIKEITPAQALLVLLLSNKKETKNLKRFRPVLLQGIAVKRITTATELDMEIEVIEKENICISQNEGISLLSTSNGYNLLDELYWIAKTTASDFQKPFDDSSKKLLKSLLEKRKKLNPSYLRVMARYVGLGLLKPKKYYN